MDGKIIYEYNNPQFRIVETEKRSKKAYNFFVGLWYYLKGFVIAEPIVLVRGKQHLDGATRQCILLRGGNLKLRIGRDHCRAGQKGKEKKGFLKTRKGVVLAHSGKRMRKVKDKVLYDRKKYGLVIGEMFQNIFI